MNRRIPFGRYRGRLVRDVPSDYLRWLAGRPDLWEPLRDAIEHELDERQSQSTGSAVDRHDECPDVATVDALIGAGVRALAKSAHPDRGGDPEKMVRINVCAAWLRSQVRRELES